MDQLSINPVEYEKGIREEYESLKTRFDSRFDFFSVAYFPLHLILASVVTGTVAFKTHDWWSTLGAAAVSFIYPGFIVSAMVCGLLSAIFEVSVQRYLLRRRETQPWFHRYKYLSQVVTELDEAERLRRIEEERREIEAKRVRLLPLTGAIHAIRAELNEFDNTADGVEAYFHRKKKWFSEYRGFEQSIHSCLDRLDDLEENTSVLEEQLHDLTPESPHSFPYLFSDIEDTRNRFNLLVTKIESMKNWTPPIRSAQYQTRTSGSVTPRQRVEVQRVKPTSIQEVEESSNDFDFSNPSEISIPDLVLPPAPPKRRVVNKALSKIPFEDYLGAANSKMKVGEMGEIIVLQYEIRRVQEETGKYGLQRVHRVSQDSDGYGYDIESFSLGEKIYIEVKSTTGPCWTDFYLTANEREVMEQKGENYWLYRIFELNREDGSAKLSIFRGRSEIDKSLELKPTTYRVRPRLDTQHSTGSSTAELQ